MVRRWRVTTMEARRGKRKGHSRIATVDMNEPSARVLVWWLVECLRKQWWSTLHNLATIAAWMGRRMSLGQIRGVPFQTYWAKTKSKPMEGRIGLLILEAIIQVHETSPTQLEGTNKIFSMLRGPNQFLINSIQQWNPGEKLLVNLYTEQALEDKVLFHWRSNVTTQIE